MGKFDGWLICSDFDGTIYVDHSISDENCAAIRYFQENGGRFTFASGRFTSMFNDFFDRVMPGAPIAGLNGAVIAEPQSGGVLYCGGIERDSAVRFALEALARYDGARSALFYTADSSVKVKEGEPMPPQMSDLPDKLAKVSLTVDADISDMVLADVTARAGEVYSVSRSWVRGIEFNSPDDTKGMAAKRIKKIVGAAHLVCVGDYENDISMIEAADIGYAVGNAVPALKAAADRVTVDCREHAIAAIIREIEDSFAAYG